MRQLVGIVGVSVLLLAARGAGEEPAQRVAVGAEAEATEPTVAKPGAGDVHRAQVEGRDMTVQVEVRPSYRRPPTESPAVDGKTILHREQWLDRELGRVIGWSLQIDPGDEANLFRIEATDSFETPLGTWTVHELGEGMFTHYMAMARHDGLVFQVIGGAPGDSKPVIDMAQTMEVYR